MNLMDDRSVPMIGAVFVIFILTINQVHVTSERWVILPS